MRKINDHDRTMSCMKLADQSTSAEPDESLPSFDAVSAGGCGRREIP